jgi:1,2-diacylglycerol 3-alpha-glucosyltransferase
MRIGIFTDAYEPYVSGVVTSAKMLKNSLEKKGHKVYIVTPNFESMKQIYEEDKRILRIPGIKLGFLYDLRVSGIYPIRAVSQVKKWKLDVIHIQTEFGIGIFGKLMAKQFNIPLVYTYHTMYEDHVHYITRGLFDNAGKKAVEYLTKIVCDKNIKEIIVPTQKAYDVLKEKYKIEHNITVIPTGIEIERFYKENFSTNVINAYKKDLGINSDETVLLYLGRVGKEKNIALIVDALKDLVSKSPKYKLLIVGDGPERKILEKKVEKLKLQNYVIFTGKVEWTMTPIYYQLGDLFLMPSRSETQGLTIIEALASSLPVLCINDDSYKSMIQDKENGRYFHDKKSCVKLILELEKDEKELQKLREGARKSVIKYSSEYFGNQVLDVYKKAIEKSSKDRFPLVTKIKDIIKKR